MKAGRRSPFVLGSECQTTRIRIAHGLPWRTDPDSHIYIYQVQNKHVRNDSSMHAVKPATWRLLWRRSSWKRSDPFAFRRAGIPRPGTTSSPMAASSAAIAAMKARCCAAPMSRAQEGGACRGLESSSPLASIINTFTFFFFAKAPE